MSKFIHMSSFAPYTIVHPFETEKQWCTWFSTWTELGYPEI